MPRLPYTLFFFSSRRRHTRLQGDWSSDVCSSDLIEASRVRDRSAHASGGSGRPRRLGAHGGLAVLAEQPAAGDREIGRASCRERVWMTGVAGARKKKRTQYTTTKT